MAMPADYEKLIPIEKLCKIHVADCLTLLDDAFRGLVSTAAVPRIPEVERALPILRKAIRHAISVVNMGDKWPDVNQEIGQVMDSLDQLHARMNGNTAPSDLWLVVALASTAHALKKAIGERRKRPRQWIPQEPNARYFERYVSEAVGHLLALCDPDTAKDISDRISHDLSFYVNYRGEPANHGPVHKSPTPHRDGNTDAWIGQQLTEFQQLSADRQKDMIRLFALGDDDLDGYCRVLVAFYLGDVAIRNHRCRHPTLHAILLEKEQLATSIITSLRASAVATSKFQIGEFHQLLYRYIDAARNRFPLDTCADFFKRACCWALGLPRSARDISPSHDVFASIFVGAKWRGLI
jgi:hypothetical protein